MPVAFTWEFNPVAMIAIIGGAATVFKFWFSSGVRADEAFRVAAETAAEVQAAHEKIALLQAQIHAHNVTQAERLVSREVLREVEGRLAGAVEKLGDRLDSTIRELIKAGKT